MKGKEGTRKKERGGRDKGEGRGGEGDRDGRESLGEPAPPPNVFPRTAPARNVSLTDISSWWMSDIPWSHKLLPPRVANYPSTTLR